MPFFPGTARAVALTYVPPQGRAVRTEESAIDDVIREAAALKRQLPAPGRLGWLTTRLRDFIGAAASDVEEEACRRPVGDPVREDALDAAREARYRLGIGPGHGYDSAITFTRSLAGGAEGLLRQQRRLRSAEGRCVPVAGTSGAGVIVVRDDELCGECRELIAERYTLEIRQDWAGMRDANTRLAEHQGSVHGDR
ncbi:DUF6415 family natural product biosynthesis protein [Streptomyces sp. NPDC002537]